MKTERRFLPTRAMGLEVRAGHDDEPATISGYAAVFYREGDSGTEFELWEGFQERIMPGAFDRAVKEDDVRALFNHDPDHILGRTAAETLTLSVDKKGLRYEVEMPDTQTARDVAESIRRGDVSGSSFAFLVTDEEYKKADGIRIREIQGVELFDVGPVTFPAYESTTTQARDAMVAECDRACLQDRRAMHQARARAIEVEAD